MASVKKNLGTAIHKNFMKEYFNFICRHQVVVLPYELISYRRLHDPTHTTITIFKQSVEALFMVLVFTVHYGPFQQCCAIYTYMFYLLKLPAEYSRLTG